MDVKKKESEFRSLNKIVPRVELLNIYMQRGNFERQPDATEYEKLGAKISFEGELFARDKEGFQALVRLSVEGKPIENEDYAVSKIESEYVLTYKLKDDRKISKSDLKAFCNMNAIYNAWPFWREYVQSATTRMEIPVLTLPLLRFMPHKQKKESKAKSEKE